MTFTAECESIADVLWQRARTRPTDAPIFSSTNSDTSRTSEAMHRSPDDLMRSPAR